MGNTIGQRMREARLALGLSQDDVARRLGVNRASISVYERGGTIPKRSFDAFCREFRVSGAYLSSGTPPVFQDMDQSLLEQVTELYHLPPFFKTAVEQWANMSQVQQKALTEFWDLCVKASLPREEPALETIRIQAAVAGPAAQGEG